MGKCYIGFKKTAFFKRLQAQDPSQEDIRILIFLVQEDCFFQAAIPIDIYEEALAELTAPTPVMQRIQIGDVTE